MEIRKVKPEECVAMWLLHTTVYLGKADADYKTKLANPLEHSEGCDKAWGAFDEKNKMLSCLVVPEYTVRFNGHDAPMEGIGGVGTLPENRKGGYVRRLFEKALADIRDRGGVFSFLFPFSFAFYRKFGYEHCKNQNIFRIPMHYFEDYPFPDNVEAYGVGSDITAYKEIYSEFVRDKNLAVVRGESNWKDAIEHDPYLTKRYAYLHRNKNNKPDAYIMYTAKEADEGENKMKILELAWINREGLRSMFGFIYGQSPMFSAVEWDAPTEFNAYAFFPEAYDIENIRHASGMNRIVNVPSALSMLCAPDGEGRVALRVNDSFLPCNNGTYEIEWGGGNLEARQSKKNPDLELSVETLAQIATGFMTPDQVREKSDVTFYANEPDIRKLFPLKNLYMLEHF